MSLRGGAELRRHLHRTAFDAVQVSNLRINEGCPSIRFIRLAGDCFGRANTALAMTYEKENYYVCSHC